MTDTDLGEMIALVDLVIVLREHRPTRGQTLRFTCNLATDAIDDVAFNRGFGMTAYNKPMNPHTHYIFCHPYDLPAVQQRVMVDEV